MGEEGNKKGILIEIVHKTHWTGNNLYSSLTSNIAAIPDTKPQCNVDNPKAAQASLTLAPRMRGHICSTSSLGLANLT